MSKKLIDMVQPAQDLKKHGGLVDFLKFRNREEFNSWHQKVMKKEASVELRQEVGCGMDLPASLAIFFCFGLVGSRRLCILWAFGRFGLKEYYLLFDSDVFY